MRAFQADNPGGCLFCSVGCGHKQTSAPHVHSVAVTMRVTSSRSLLHDRAKSTSCPPGAREKPASVNAALPKKGLRSVMSSSRQRSSSCLHDGHACRRFWWCTAPAVSTRRTRPTAGCVNPPHTPRRRLCQPGAHAPPPAVSTRQAHTPRRRLCQPGAHAPPPTHPPTHT